MEEVRENSLIFLHHAEMEEVRENSLIFLHHAEMKEVRENSLIFLHHAEMEEVRENWALLNNKDVRDKYVLELRNRFETLQEKTEKSTPNDEYENFVNAHLEAAAKYIPTKNKTKYRVPWETLAVREKRALVKTASKNYRKNTTNTNALKLKTAQYQLAGIYIKEQTEYIQNQIDKIRDSVEDRQSRIAWQTINEVSRRKNTAKAKLKAANQQERIKLWKQHFENLLGNPPKKNA